MILLGELLAFVLSLGPTSLSGSFWSDLGIVSLFVQWVVLSSAGLLCLARPRLQHLSIRATTLSVLALVTLVVALVSIAAIVSIRWSGLHLHWASGWEGALALKNLAMGLIITAAALRYFYLWHRLEVQVRAEAEARLQALQARIRPHFLFNSMNTMASLIAVDPERAEETLLDLSDMFRASLNDERKLVPLREELQLTRRYLAIESARLGERLQVDWQLDPSLDGTPIPSLSLQPLVENAIYHGIEPNPEAGALYIRSAREDGHALIEIRNSLPQQPPTARRSGQRMAQENTRARLEACFGDEAHFEIDADGHHYRVRLEIPCLS